MAMFLIKKDGAMWHVKLASNLLTVYRSMSKKLCQEWRDTNEPIPVHEQLNATAGVKVWRGRENNTL
jgi:hypothetical protein